MNKKTIIMMIAIILIIVLIAGISYGTIKKYTQKVQNPIATIEVNGYDTPIVIELYPDKAPNTVKNFIALANGEFYDGLIIHRVEKNFVIQGGDPKGDGSGGPTYNALDKSVEKGSDADKEYTIVGEFSRNGYDNDIKHERGVISMARSSYSAEVMTEGYNSAGSQFFICLSDTPNLNGQYAAFGKVIKGMEETVDKISDVELGTEKNEETGEETTTNKPKEDVVISKIRVETNGIEYGKPEINEKFDFSSWYMKKYYGMGN